MSHLIPQPILDRVTAGPSQTRRDQAVNLNAFIQGLFGDSYHTFLQGSYKNHTAISDLPDIDIVVMRSQTYSGTHSPHAGGHPTISWGQIFSPIKETLGGQKKYSWTLTEKEKCIKITGDLNADVVPAVKYHHDHLIDPIAIRSYSQVERLSFPRLHIKNGEAKNVATNNNFKPTVRMFKRWACNHFDGTDTVSSHKIEALVHAADNSLFSADPAAAFLLVGSDIKDKLASIIVGSSILSVCGSENILNTWDINARTAFREKLQQSLYSVALAYQATSAVEADRHWRTAFNM